MQATIPLTRDVLLIGGGHAHALFLRMWGMNPLPGARLTLVNPEPVAAYTGMLPGLIAGHYKEDDLEIDLIRLARFAGARIILDQVTGLDPEAQTASFANRPPVAFDIASINVGITSPLPGIPGEVQMVRAKPLHLFASRWQDFVKGVELGAPATAGIIGGGFGGIELAMAMAYRLRGIAADRTRVHVFEAEPEIIPGSDTVRGKVLEAVEKLDISIHSSVELGKYESETLSDIDGRETQVSFLGLATGAGPAHWLTKTGLALVDGFVNVDKFLRSVSHQQVFAVGDIAHMQASARPKAGVFAVRQAPALYHNICAALSGRRLRRFSPQKDYLKLVSLGGKDAIAEKFGRTYAGPAAWRWKDRIDRKFMRKLTRFEPMKQAVPRNAALGVANIMAEGPLCGGCGAKVGQAALRDALTALPDSHRADIEQGAGDDAAILRIGDKQQVVTTDHFRAFIEDPYLLARIAANHALGDIWAMGATPQAALISVILPRMSDAMQLRTMREIFAGATSVLGPAGAEIVGGHSSTGAELTLGFTLTGLADGRLVSLKGAEPGDALILTKPLGVGTILAGDMRLVADGRTVVRALDQMVQSPRGDAVILAQVAHAMTDVTGYSLAGHLKTMLDASVRGAELDLEAVPFIEGAVDLAGRGVHSSLLSQNRVDLNMNKKQRKDARIDLLFDPQTAGGMLAAVPQMKVDEVLGQLSGLGWVIGRVVPKTGIRVV